MYSPRNQKICLTEFIPIKVICKDDPEKSFELYIEDIGNYLNLSYFTGIYNSKGLVGKQKRGLLFPKYVRRNQETFEVLGLLQAEMGKQHDGKIVFCNHEYRLVRKVMRWFEREFKESRAETNTISNRALRMKVAKHSSKPLKIRLFSTSQYDNTHQMHVLRQTPGAFV